MDVFNKFGSFIPQMNMATNNNDMSDGLKSLRNSCEDDSLLLNFPSLPANNDSIHGCFELNAQFQFGFSSDFDKNIIIVIINYKVNKIVI
jgi:hypothetical protein